MSFLVCIQECVQSNLQAGFGVLDDYVNIVGKAHFSPPRKVHLPLYRPAAVIIATDNVVDISNNFKIQIGVFHVNHSKFKMSS